jgi:broad specificity phosphatase PhoE
MTANEFVGIPYPPRATSKEIVFIRHAESEGNVQGRWHGHTDGPLSPDGEASLEALGKRLSEWEFDVVISSPLTRARHTAACFAEDVVVDEEFIEMNVGRWEGLTFDEADALHRDEMEAAFRDWTVPMGGGESLHDVGRRAEVALGRVFGSLADGQRAAVVTHGGLLQSVLHRFLPGKGRRVHPIASNTSITRVVWQFGRPRLASFNDTGHLGPRPRLVTSHLDRGTPVLALVRHGRTRANIEQRWQGHGDWDLDDVGTRQARSLAAWYGPSRTVYSSPLRRAMATARHVALTDVVSVDGLKEMDMGEWEGLTSDEIISGWPDAMETIYRGGVDLRRGAVGESWGELTARVAGAIGGLAPASDEPTIVVAHGGAIRSYISSLTATNDSHSESLYTPPNTSVTHVALTDRGPELLDYAVATHLESADHGRS